MTQTEEESTEETTSIEPEIVVRDVSLSLEALKIIKEAQQQHGLRHSDYLRYRSYCTRRVRRLRKTLKLCCGTTRRFQKRDVTVDDLSTVSSTLANSSLSSHKSSSTLPLNVPVSASSNLASKCLLIPLFQAERAWAYAMQLKQEANTETRKKYHLASRLRKAVKFAADLERLTNAQSAPGATMRVSCDVKTRLEAQGYAQWMNGQLAFETQKWSDALRCFTLAKQLYEKLAELLKGDDSQMFYLQRASEVLPNIRYCNYNMGDESAKLDLVNMKMQSVTGGSNLAENIDLLISQTKENQIKTFTEVVWRQNTLHVKNERVRLFLLNVQEYEKQIQTSANNEVKQSICENILKESVDVIQLLRDELKTDPGFKNIQRGQVLPADEKPSNLLLLFAHLTWIRINKTIERNLLMAEAYKQLLGSKSGEEKGKETKSKALNVKPQDIVRIYDLIIQNISDMSNLPGLSNDHQLLADNELLTSYYKTFRVYYISLFYLANKKFKEAAGFCFKVEKYLKEAQAALKQSNKKSDISEKQKSDMQTGLASLQSELNQSKYHIQTAAILEDEDGVADGEKAAEAKLDETDEKLEKKPLVDRLDHYFEDLSLTSKAPNVIRLPLSFEAIPCKPLFFDLAQHHVELPPLDDKIEAKKLPQAKEGVKGFFKGWLGLN